jgi:hypothetical protein
VISKKGADYFVILVVVDESLGNSLLKRQVLQNPKCFFDNLNFSLWAVGCLKNGLVGCDKGVHQHC